MTTPTAPISLSNIQTEFGGANPISLSEYYRGGAYVPSTQATSVPDGVPVPGSGTIRIGMFRALTKAVTINLTINANTTDYNIRTAAGNPGVVANVTLTINGFYVYGSSTAVYALQTGSGWVAGSTITIVNNGVVQGAGGNGGASVAAGAGGAGGQGGHAFLAQYPVTVYNNNTFGGGGGGGGGAGSYLSGKTYVAAGGGGGGRGPSTGGAGGAPGAPGTVSAPGAGGSFGLVGGSGGNLGLSGGTGQSSIYAGGAGGPPGNYVVGAGFVTWATIGSRLGPAS